MKPSLVYEGCRVVLPDSENPAGLRSIVGLSMPDGTYAVYLFEREIKHCAHTKMSLETFPDYLTYCEYLHNLTTVPKERRGEYVALTSAPETKEIRARLSAFVSKALSEIL